MAPDGLRRARFQAMHHRGGSESVRLPGLPGRSARDRFHRRAGVAAGLQAAAGHRRRHHRPGNGLRVRCARRQSHRGRTQRRPDAGHRSRSGAPAAKAHRKALRENSAEDQSGEARGAPGGCAPLSRDPMPPNRRCSIGCWWPWAAPPTAIAINAAAAGVRSSARGIIAVDKQMRTNVPHIFAIGDIAGAPMLAHKATHEAKVAAEVAAGHKSAFDARCIPVGGVHRSGNRLGRLDRNRSQGARHRIRQGNVSLGCERPFAGAQSR